MQRINSANVHEDLFGPGKHGFQGGNPALNLPATFLTDDWCNHIQEEIAAVIEASGQALNGAVYNQLLLAIQSILTQAVPAGTVIYVPFSTAPSGYLKANGALANRSVYSALFSKIGTTFGVGDGATSFGLPDLRGEFIRGWDDTRGIDASRALGSFQADAIRNITGRFAAVQTGQFADGAFYHAGGQNGSDSGGDFRSYIQFDASRVVPTAADNRPRNIALLACIKY